MAKSRDIFLGGNTCYGFYSFYDYMVPSDVIRKYILKGGPGVGKSVFMKKVAEDFVKKGFDIEYCWCSSDNDSLDGITIANGKLAFVDGTAPHIIEPKYPGAVDVIIDLGQFWQQDSLINKRTNIINLTDQVSTCFKRAYLRLQEANLAYEELKTYYQETVDLSAVKRNITALAEDFLSGINKTEGKVRHLFPGAITPGGLVNKLASIVNKDIALFTVKGSPGSGVKSLFNYVVYLLEARGIEAEVFHNPFNPEEIDLILLPETQAVLIDLSDFFFDYSSEVLSNKYKRQLDFNIFINKSALDISVKNIDNAQNRIEDNIKAAVSFIKQAKAIHDELESHYIATMDYVKIEVLRQNIVNETMGLFTNP